MIACRGRAGSRWPYWSSCAVRLRRSSMSYWSGRLIMWVLVGSLVLLGPATRSEAGEPQNKIRQTVDDVLGILDNKNLDPEQRRTQIRQAVLKRFGFEEMAQRAL